MDKLSVVIITFNEERNIKRCLESVKDIADEIIVVDSFSTDRTKKISTQYNVVFLEREFEGYSSQKQFAVDQATFNYILNLDADEALDDDLKKAILDAKNHFRKDAYTLNRLTNYCGTWIKHGSWYPDRLIRLWNKKKGRFSGDLIHEFVNMDEGTTQENLRGNLLHYSYYTVNEHLNKMKSYSDMSALSYFEKGRKSNFIKILVNPAFKFFRDYFLKLGFLDGFYGFVVCKNSAYENYLKYLKLYELQKEKSIKPS